VAKVDYSGRIAGSYRAGRRLRPESVSSWMDAVGRHLARRDGPVLDLGSGTGRFSGALTARLGVPVVALEPAEGMRDQARLDGIGGRVAMVAGSGEAVPARDGVFVGVWASQVLHHVDDLTRCTAELRRVVRPGGPVMVRGMFEATYGSIPWTPYFPEAVRVGTDLFPTLEEITAAFGYVGMKPCAHEIIWQTTAASMCELSERVRLRADSTLELLSEDEFATGMARLQAAAAAETSPKPIREALELLVFA
jgi:ubiquinone/menaquinone biosynthesis C-methylase UbiE